jgi:hypothetical protein
MTAHGHDEPARGRDDAHNAAGSGPLPDPDLVNVVIPDDISSLSADIRAYHRELRQARRRDAVRFLTGRRGQEPARDTATRPVRLVPLPMMVALLLPAAMVIAAMILVLPQALREPLRQVPLATSATAPGNVGGLLPNGTVTVDNQPASLRGDVRPAVLLVVPGNCAVCDPSHLPELVSHVVTQADGQNAPARVYLVATGGMDVAQLDRIASNLGGEPGVIPDAGSLFEPFHPSGVTAILVRADGVVANLDRNLPASPDLAGQLNALTPN